MQLLIQAFSAHTQNLLKQRSFNIFPVIEAICWFHSLIFFFYYVLKLSVGFF